MTKVYVIYERDRDETELEDYTPTLFGCWSTLKEATSHLEVLEGDYFSFMYEYLIQEEEFNGKEKIEPWEECKDVWPTQAAYFNWMRGQMRRAWSRHPVKVKFIKLNTFMAPVGRILKTTGKRKKVKAAKCAHCQQTFPVNVAPKQIQVDHITAAGSFKGWDDFTTWMQGLMHISLDDLQFLCTTCHGVKSYAESNNMTIEQAAIEKRVVAFGKLTAAKQKDILMGIYGNLDGITNIKQRKAGYREYLKRG